MSKLIEVDVITTIRQTIEVPEDYDKQDLFNFLAQEQSFNDAFKGMTNDAYPGMTILDVSVIDEDVE